MSAWGHFTRRRFLHTVTATGVAACVGDLGAIPLPDHQSALSQIFRVNRCPVPDGQNRHVGVDVLIDLMAENGLKLYRTASTHPWGGPAGLIASGDVVLIKVNCAFSFRGTTNTDVIRGLIQRILDHPDGFGGEVVIFESGQGIGRFNGYPQIGEGRLWYPAEYENQTWINAEEQNVMSVEHLVNTVYAGDPVSSYLLDPIRETFIDASNHTTDGYRTVSDVSYPCFTTAGGNRVELREGVWTGTEHTSNLSLINVPVFKHHDETNPDDTGISGALKHCYGMLSMSDGQFPLRHYTKCGEQCGKMYSLVRAPDLNILDCIWVPHASQIGWPEETTTRANTLIASRDPVALDHFGSKHLMVGLGGPYADRHDPDTWPGLIRDLAAARDTINLNGGLPSGVAQFGDDNIEVFERDAAVCGVAMT